MQANKEEVKKAERPVPTEAAQQKPSTAPDKSAIEKVQQTGEEFEMDIDNFKALQQKTASVNGTDGAVAQSQLNELSPNGNGAGLSSPPQIPQSPEERKRHKSPEEGQLDRVDDEKSRERVHNVEEDGHGFFITGINTHDVERQPTVPEEQPDPADKYKHVAVVDCSKAFSNQECVLISDKNKSITYLNASSAQQFKFDCLVTSHSQVQHLCNRWIHKFIAPSKKSERDRIVLNFADQFNCNNNAGFNLTNFKVQFINQFFQDVINDYEKSVIGTFTKSLLDKLNDTGEGEEQYEPLKDSLELYFTITKFENDIGFSLIHQEPENDEDGNDVNQDIGRVEEGTGANTTYDSVPRDVSPEANHPRTDGEVTLEQRGLDQSPPQRREDRARANRKAQLTRHGVIPEYIKISEIYQVYTAFTQANLKNSILHQKQARRLAELSEDGAAPAAYKETELKEDVLLIQFKLVEKASYRTINTFNFVNLPLAKLQDNNVSTLIEILNKLKKLSGLGPYLSKKRTNTNDFIPFRKSILTRVMAEQLQRHNFLVLSHFSKHSLGMHFKHGSGPSKNLFNQIETLFGDKPGTIVKKKLNDQQAIKMLQQKFKRETQQIFGQLEQFREGTKSFEVFTKQTAAQMPRSLSVKGSVTPTMFQQILQFLSYKDEILQGYEEGTQNTLFMRQAPTHDIQKVIFDKNYIKFTQDRQRAQQQQEQEKLNNSGLNINTIGYRQSNDLNRSRLPPAGPRGVTDNQFQMSRLQYVQYECLKTELKEEYDKRVNFLHKRIEMRQAQQGPYQDAHLILMQNNYSDPRGLGKRNSERGGAKYGSLSASQVGLSLERDLLNLGTIGASSSAKNARFGGDRANNAMGPASQGGALRNRRQPHNTLAGVKDRQGGHSQEREQYYKFYLDSAQKAIEMMRKQHKSASIMRANVHSRFEGPVKSECDPTVGSPSASGLPEVNIQGNTPISPINKSGKAMRTNTGSVTQEQLMSMSNVDPDLVYRSGHDKSLKGKHTTRLLEPLFGQGKAPAPAGTMMKSGKSTGGHNFPGATPGREGDLSDMARSQNFNAATAPRASMIKASDQVEAAKPNSAAEGQRYKKLRKDVPGARGGMSEARYGASSKQSTNFTGANPLTSVKRGPNQRESAATYMPAPKQRGRSLAGLGTRQGVKNFMPLRDQGRIGGVAIAPLPEGRGGYGTQYADRTGGLRSKQLTALSGPSNRGYKSVQNFNGGASADKKPMAAPTLKNANNDGLKSQNLHTKKLNPIVPAPEQKAATSALNSHSPGATPERLETKKVSQQIETDSNVERAVKETITASIPESSIEVDAQAKSNSASAIDPKSTMSK